MVTTYYPSFHSRRDVNVFLLLLFRTDKHAIEMKSHAYHLIIFRFQALMATEDSLIPNTVPELGKKDSKTLCKNWNIYF